MPIVVMTPEELRELVEEAIERALAKNHTGPRLVQDADTDDLIAADEAAKLLGVDRRWLYTHRLLPFRVSLGRKTLRFSRSGLLKWKRAQALRR